MQSALIPASGQDTVRTQHLRQTLLCSYLSAVLLVGLVLNGAFGWFWADPLAALVIAGVAVKEGAAAWRGDVCCVPASGRVQPAGGCGDSCCQD